MSANDLAATLARLQDDHAGAPAVAAQALNDLAAELRADDTGADALRLAEHVMLGHCGDAGALRCWLARLPTGLADRPPTAAAVQRASWAAAQLDRGPATAPPLPQRWRALQSVALAWVARGECDRAAQVLADEERAAAAEPEAAALQPLAASANNLALHLREAPDRSTAHTALMLQAAATSARLWARAGTWLSVERAEYQLALCHAAAGRPGPSLGHARQCLALCEREGADAAERFFAHEALWHAHRAAADAAAQQAAHQAMVALLPQVQDADLQAWCASVLQGLPSP
ncbi:hypothetical protein BurJ1DRAFT_4935 [Burkholderiales bacterium JOSHI_001]|nr:hypothetical protein BurJ1DRAFT_4935 [Burkholderiales bacterium JOSHI_001]